MFTIMSNAERTEFKVIWHHNRQKRVVRVFPTYSEASRWAWSK